MKKACIFFGMIAFFLFVNLANATLININARSNSSANPVELFLEAGTYSVEPVGIAGGGAYDSWNAWGWASCNNPAGCPKTYPTSYTGWLNSYYVISPFISAASVDGIDLAPFTANPPPYDSHYLVSPRMTLVNADDTIVHPTAHSAFLGALKSMFTITQSGRVGFAITDGPTLLGDNSGGLSLEINLASVPGPGPAPSPVPEPGSLFLLGFGISCLAGYGKLNLKRN